MKILIAEDDVLISEELASLLKELNYTITSIAWDFESASKALKQEVPDLAILDINMNGKQDGFKIAGLIKEKYSIPFLFLTSYSDKSTVSEAAFHLPSAYLVKPFSKETIFSTMEMIRIKLQNEKYEITLKVNSENRTIDLNQILYLKADDVYLEVHLKNERILIRKGLSKFLEEQNVNFLKQVHRSFAININQVKQYTNSEIIFENIKIPISRSNKEKVIQILQNRQ